MTVRIISEAGTTLWASTCADEREGYRMADVQLIGWDRSKVQVEVK